MQDRVPVNPGRVLIAPENGAAPYYATMTRADNPTQEGTALNKATLLKDATAALFGLDTSAVPNDVLAFLGRYNCHWWSVLHGQARVEYKEKRTLSAQSIECSNMKGNGTVTYADSITIDQSSGAISLVSPETTTFAAKNTAAQNETVLLSLRGKYLTDIRLDSASSVSTGVIVYVPVNAEYMATDAYIGYSGFKASTCYVVSAEVVNIPAGETTYVHSTDRNAYPDSGTVDGLTYQYLGIPFQNAVTAPKIESGLYTGTGTFGADNPNSLTFGFVPDLVLIIGDGSKVDTNNYQALTLYAVLWYGDATAYLTFTNTSNVITSNSKGIALSWDSTTVTWYVTATNATAASQMSSSGKVYRYLAIKL